MSKTCGKLAEAGLKRTLGEMLEKGHGVVKGNSVKREKRGGSMGAWGIPHFIRFEDAVVMRRRDAAVERRRGCCCDKEEMMRL
jgi:hypothetical protein